MPIFMPKYVSTDDGETFHLDFDDKGRETRIEIEREELKQLVNEATILLEITGESDNRVETEEI